MEIEIKMEIKMEIKIEIKIYNIYYFEGCIHFRARSLDSVDDGL